MKAIKTLACVIAAVAALVLGTSSASASGPTTTTNDIILTLTLTISTNSVSFASDSNYTYKVTSVKLTNKNLLAILEGSDFANQPFATGDQIAIAYDWNGDVVVVDKTGTNVLYDATANYGNSNNATLAISLATVSLARVRGAESVAFNYKPSGSINYTMDNVGSFTLLDNPNNTYISGNGSSTVAFSQALIKGKDFTTNNPFASWTDSAKFSLSGANNQFGLNQTNVTISGTITAKGKGTSVNLYFLTFIIS
jgi:hypothetical protein